MSRRRRGFVTVLGWVAVAAVVGTAGFLGGRWTFSPPTSAPATPDPPTFTITSGNVGEHFDITVDVTWTQTATGVNPATGTVTSAPFLQNQLVNEGDVVYTVDLRPVVAARGAVPAFRDLARGSKGADVAQLQRFLVAQGFDAGMDDGVYGASTLAAVKGWQRALGVDPTGAVMAGDLFFVEQLPAHVNPMPDFYVGAPVTRGQRLLTIVESAPTFTARLSTQQISQLPSSGAAVVITGPESAWHAITGSILINADGSPSLELLAAGQGPICGDECGQLSHAAGEQVLTGTVITTPEVTGPVVPLSALGTDPVGHNFVILSDGTRVAVSVLGSDGARAVLEGVAVGDEVRLFAGESKDDAADAGEVPSE